MFYFYPVFGLSVTKRKENLMKKTIFSLIAVTAALPAFAQKPYYNTDSNQFEFTSPSRNIRCQGDRAASDDDSGFNGVECSVFSGNGRGPSVPELPAPKDCDLDSITVFTIKETGKAKRYAACTGDTYYNINNSVRVLPYGETVRGKGWQCVSNPQGMRCENTQQHGFSINRSRQNLF